MRSLVVEYRSVGEALWQRFSASRDQSLWYYASLLRVFEEVHSTRRAVLVRELATAIQELQRLIHDSESTT